VGKQLGVVPARDIVQRDDVELKCPLALVGAKTSAEEPVVPLDAPHTVELR
jgi:hypothetical protein